MSLEIAFIGEAAGAHDARSTLLEEALRARGDHVRVWPWSSAPLPVAIARAMAQLHRGHQEAPFDLVVLCGSAGLALAGAPVLRLRGIKTVLDLSPRPSGAPLTSVEILAAHLVDATVASDLAGYEALLAAKLPTYRALLIKGAPSPVHFSPRSSEPKAKDRLGLLVVIEDPAQVPALGVALEDVRGKHSQLRLELMAPAALHPALDLALQAFPAGRWSRQELPSDPALRAERLSEAHLLVSVGAPRELLREAFALGVGTLAVDPPADLADGTTVVPASELAAMIGRVLKDKKLRQAAAEQAKAADQESGHPALLRAWLRLVDHLCRARPVKKTVPPASEPA